MNNLDTGKLRESARLYLSSIGVDTSDASAAQKITALVERTLLGTTFPELGKLDTQKKIDAGAVLLLKLAQDERQSDHRSTVASICEANGHPEATEAMVQICTLAPVLMEWISIFPDEIRASIPKTVEYYESSRDIIEYAQNNIVKITLAKAQGIIIPGITEAVKAELMSFDEMCRIFQDETGFPDSLLADPERIASILEMWVSNFIQ